MGNTRNSIMFPYTNHDHYAARHIDCLNPSKKSLSTWKIGTLIMHS